MNAGSSVKPRKAQVKDKGLGAESGDFDEVSQTKVGPDGLEPSTHGLKVRCSTD